MDNLFADLRLIGEGDKRLVNPALIARPAIRTES
jgi:hypothetical protein